MSQARNNRSGRRRSQMGSILQHSSGVNTPPKRARTPNKNRRRSTMASILGGRSPAVQKTHARVKAPFATDSPVRHHVDEENAENVADAAMAPNDAPAQVASPLAPSKLENASAAPASPMAAKPATEPMAEAVAETAGWSVWRSRCSSLEQALTAAQKAVVDVEDRLETEQCKTRDAVTALNNERLVSRRTGEQLAALQATYDAMEAQCQTMGGELDSFQEKTEDLERRLRRTEADLGAERSTRHKLEEELESTRTQLANLTLSSNTHIELVERQLEDERKFRLDAEQALFRESAALQSSQNKLGSMQEDMELAVHEKDASQRLGALTQEKFDQAVAAMHKAMSQLNEEKTARMNADRTIKDLRMETNELVSRKDDTIAKLTAQVAALEATVRQKEDVASAARHAEAKGAATHATTEAALVEASSSAAAQTERAEEMAALLEDALQSLEATQNALDLKERECQEQAQTLREMRESQHTAAVSVQAADTERDTATATAAAHADRIANLEAELAIERKTTSALALELRELRAHATTSDHTASAEAASASATLAAKAKACQALEEELQTAQAAISALENTLEAERDALTRALGERDAMDAANAGLGAQLARQKEATVHAEAQAQQAARTSAELTRKLDETTRALQTTSAELEETHARLSAELEAAVTRAELAERTADQFSLQSAQAERKAVAAADDVAAISHALVATEDALRESEVSALRTSQRATHAAHDAAVAGKRAMTAEEELAARMRAWTDAETLLQETAAQSEAVAAKEGKLRMMAEAKADMLRSQLASSPVVGEGLVGSPQHQASPMRLRRSRRLRSSTNKVGSQ